MTSSTLEGSDYKPGDVVLILDKTNPRFNKTAKVTKVRTVTSSIEVRVLGDSYDRSFWYNQVRKIDPPKVGDLVQVLTYGKWQAQQGHVSLVSEEYDGRILYSVDLDDDVPDFEAHELEVIERVPPIPVVREEGKEIHHSHVQEGDKIRVEIVTCKNQMKSTEINEGEFRDRNNYGTLFSVGGGVLLNAHSLTVAESVKVILVKKAEDQITRQVRSLKTGSIIAWENKLSPTMRVALKSDDGKWNVMAPHGGAFIYLDEDVVRFIKTGVESSYKVLREAE